MAGPGSRAGGDGEGRRGRPEAGAGHVTARRTWRVDQGERGGPAGAARWRREGEGAAAVPRAAVPTTTATVPLRSAPLSRPFTPHFPSAPAARAQIPIQISCETCRGLPGPGPPLAAPRWRGVAVPRFNPDRRAGTFPCRRATHPPARSAARGAEGGGGGGGGREEQDEEGSVGRGGAGRVRAVRGPGRPAGRGVAWRSAHHGGMGRAAACWQCLAWAGLPPRAPGRPDAGWAAGPCLAMPSSEENNGTGAPRSGEGRGKALLR